MKVNIEELKTGKKMIKIEASLCGICKAMEPTWNRFVEQNTDDSITMLKVNLDENPDMAEEFDISAIPAFIALKDGEELGRLVGRCDIKQLTGLKETL